MQLINELDKVLCFIRIRLYPLTRSSILWGMYVFDLFTFIIDLTINKENENLSSDDNNIEKFTAFSVHVHTLKNGSQFQWEDFLLFELFCPGLPEGAAEELEKPDIKLQADTIFEVE